MHSYSVYVPIYNITYVCSIKLRDHTGIWDRWVFLKQTLMSSLPQKHTLRFKKENFSELLMSFACIFAHQILKVILKCHLVLSTSPLNLFQKSWCPLFISPETLHKPCKTWRNVYFPFFTSKLQFWNKLWKFQNCISKKAKFCSSKICCHVQLFKTIWNVPEAVVSHLLVKEQHYSKLLKKCDKSSQCHFKWPREKFQ